MRRRRTIAVAIAAVAAAIAPVAVAVAITAVFLALLPVVLVLLAPSLARLRLAVVFVLRHAFLKQLLDVDFRHDRCAVGVAGLGLHRAGRLVERGEKAATDV